MGIGAGITLIVLGLILVLGVVQVDIPWVNEYALGVILTLGGIVSIVLVLTLWRDRRPWGTYPRGRGTTRVIEREVDDPNYL